MNDQWRIWLFWLGVILLFAWLASRPSVAGVGCQPQWDGQAYVCE